MQFIKYNYKYYIKSESPTNAQFHHDQISMCAVNDVHLEQICPPEVVIKGNKLTMAQLTFICKFTIL